MVTTVYASVCRSWSGRTLLLCGRAPPYASCRPVRPSAAPCVRPGTKPERPAALSDPALPCEIRYHPVRPGSAEPAEARFPGRSPGAALRAGLRAALLAALAASCGALDAGCWVLGAGDRRPGASGQPPAPGRIYEIRRIPGAASRNCALAGEHGMPGRPNHRGLARLEYGLISLC